jgi:hypothetical protein
MFSTRLSPSRLEPSMFPLIGAEVAKNGGLRPKAGSCLMCRHWSDTNLIPAKVSRSF